MSKILGSCPEIIPPGCIKDGCKIKCKNNCEIECICECSLHKLEPLDINVIKKFCGTDMIYVRDIKHK